VPDNTKVDYGQSTQDADFEQRRAEERGEAETLALGGRDFSGGRTEDELDSYVGADPIYRNAANEVDLPQSAPEDSALGHFEDKHIDSSDGVIVGAPERVAAGLGVLRGVAAQEQERKAAELRNEGDHEGAQEQELEAQRTMSAPMTGASDVVAGAAGAGGTKAAAANASNTAAKNN
jgi:hypothetical protein